MRRSCSGAPSLCGVGRTLTKISRRVFAGRVRARGAARCGEASSQGDRGVRVRKRHCTFGEPGPVLLMRTLDVLPSAEDEPRAWLRHREGGGEGPKKWHCVVATMFFILATIIVSASPAIIYSRTPSMFFRPGPRQASRQILPPRQQLKATPRPLRLAPGHAQ